MHLKLTVLLTDVAIEPKTTFLKRHREVGELGHFPRLVTSEKVHIRPSSLKHQITRNLCSLRGLLMCWDKCRHLE